MNHKIAPSHPCPVSAITTPELSQDDLRQIVSKAIQATNKDSYLQDLFADTVVYRDKKEKLYRQAYALTDGSVRLLGKAEEVVKVTEYQPVRRTVRKPRIKIALPWK